MSFRLKLLLGDEIAQNAGCSMSSYTISMGIPMDGKHSTRRTRSTESHLPARISRFSLTYLSIYLSIYLYLSVYLSIYLSIYLTLSHIDGSHASWRHMSQSQSWYRNLGHCIASCETGVTSKESKHPYYLGRSV